MSEDGKEVIRLGLQGRDAEWGNLQRRLLGAIQGVIMKLEAFTESDAQSHDDALVGDVTAIASRWAKAKIEKPSLENEKLRAEIASEYAEAKRRLAESKKLATEDSHIRLKMVGEALDHLEKVLRLEKVLQGVSFAHSGGDGHLFLGLDPKALPEAGD